jgi:hypothetical protein
MAGDPEAIEYPEPVEVDTGEPLHDRIRVEPFDPEMQAVTVEDPRGIRFTAGGDRFEWVSAEPIVTAPARVFVWHDRGHRCRPGEAFGVGTDPDPSGRLPER